MKNRSAHWGVGLIFIVKSDVVLRNSKTKYVVVHGRALSDVKKGVM